jgi:hypothetical protein
MATGLFSRDEIRWFLAYHGYISHSLSLKPMFPLDYIDESSGIAYLDLDANAVRKRDEVPDRPIRISFSKIFDGVNIRWTLKCVEELPHGVPSKALDRHPDTPKISPWSRK